MEFNQWINDNYTINLNKLINYCYTKYKSRLSTEEIEDLYNSSILELLESKKYKDGLINSYDSYLFIIFKNKTLKILKEKSKNIIDNDINPEYILDGNLLDDINPEYLLDHDYFMNYGFKLLEKNLEKTLSKIEFYIFKDYVYNKLTLKDIGKYVGRKTQTIYVYKLKIMKIIKKELLDNHEKYFG